MVERLTVDGTIHSHGMRIALRCFNDMPCSRHQKVGGSTLPPGTNIFTQMKISIANDELDAKEIYELYSEWAMEKISPKTPKITFKELKETLKKSTTFLAKIEGKIAGFLICKIKKSKEDTIMYHLKKGETYAEIDSIYVKKNLRNKGIGKELMVFCKKELKNHGHKKIIILADSVNLKKLMDFYEKNGFNPLFVSMICED